LFPRGNVHPFFHPQGWTLSTVYIEAWRGEQRISPPTRQNSLMGNNFAPGDQSLPLGAKLRICYVLHVEIHKIYPKTTS
jgi:hypothetical protein